MPSTTLPGQRRTNQDSPEVDAAERKVGSLLDELEQAVDGEVQNISLQDMVDTDAAGRPVVRKAVDIQVQPRPKRSWSR